MTITLKSTEDLFERRNIDMFNDLGGLAAFEQEFETDLQTGLTKSESQDNYASRKAKYGENILPDPPKQTWCRMFIECFRDLMLKILLVSALISLILTSVFPPNGKPHIEDYIDTISIFIAVLIVSIVQAQTNYAQQQAFLEINKLKNEFNVNVIRDGEEQQILNTELLVGDILVLKNGDRVAADALYISGHNLKIDNSQETGESVAVSISEKHPFILGGGAVESGDAHSLVAAVGIHSQSGVTMMKIQEASQEREMSPLEKKLERVAVLITYIGLGGSLLTFLVLLIFWIINVVDIVKNSKFQTTLLNDLVNKFMIAVTIFICAVPEGLPLAVTLSLGFSMKKMMKDNNFVRHLQACETMGGATTICSDKTGTLTQNKMTVVRLHLDGKDYKQNPDLPEKISSLLSESIAVNTSAYMTIKEGKTTPEYIGSSSECALLQMLPHFNKDYKSIREEYPIAVLHEFDSTRKRMSTIVKKGEQYRVYTKGAPDFVLRLCKYYTKLDGTKAELDEALRQDLLDTVSKFADDSLRTMMLAYSDLESGEIIDEWEDPNVVEQNLTIIGIVGIQDPLRPEVKHAIDQCKTARVVVRMVTGDFINTAKAISKECGILDDDGIAMTGEEFSTKSKIELLDILPRLRVMARSSPRDKFRLVSLLMECGEVVAVTGDGSNDSAALKKANVGLSMGQCGTELAKMASDIVILDDNFNSIVSALRWGRCVYDNVRGFLQFQLTVNFAAMIIAFIGSVALHDSPLKALQLLWVNLIMDSLGALALATRGPCDALLLRPPYGESDGLISNVLLRNIIGHCIYQLAILNLILFGAKSVFGINDPDVNYHNTHVSTLIFNTFVYCQVFNLINARVAGQDMSIFDGLFSNWVFLFIFVLIGGLQAILSELGKDAFDTINMTAKEWGICIGFGAGSLVIGAILRLIRLPDRTTEKLDALREEKRLEIKSKYQGMTAEEMWEYVDEPENKEGEIDSPLLTEKQEDIQLP